MMATADVFLSQLNMGSPYLEPIVSEKRTSRFPQQEDVFQFGSSQSSSSAFGSQYGPLSDASLNVAEDIRTIQGSPFTYKMRSEDRSPFQYGYTLGGAASPFSTTSPITLGSPYKRRWGSESPIIRRSSDSGALARAADLGTILGDMASGELEFADERVDSKGETPIPIRLRRKVFGEGSPLTPIPPSGSAKRRKVSITIASEEDEMSSPARSSPIRPRERSIRLRARRLTSTASQASSPLSSPSRPPNPRPATPPSPVRAMRQLPDGTQVTDGFPRWYRTFPKIKTGGVGGAGATKNTNIGLVGRKKETGDDLSEDDLYTPRWVKGRGTSKLGLCPVCGEEGKSKWFAMKFSAYNYHMQYAHGISAATNRPFDPPLKTRIGPPSGQPLASTSSASSSKSKSVSRTGSSSSQSSFSSSSKGSLNLKPEHEKLYGLCGKCDTWVPVEGLKDAPKKVPEMVWWKHARGCGARG